MSASIDKGPGGSGEDSRAVLSTWLDDYIAGRCDRAKMHESFLHVCRSNPEAPWDALALLDQYQRRGRIDTALTRSLKAEIAQLVFGVANQTTEEPRDTEEVQLDTTGSRWRKLYAERGAASVNADEAVQDPVRQDFDPVTRPPPMTRVREPSPQQETRESSKPAAPTSVGVGTILRERYELMEVLGSGRSGTVYQAFDRHRSHLPAPACYVAVRVLKLPQEGRESLLANIERESYEAQSLSHPNIVSVIDLDRHADMYFVVMEMLDGEPLSQVIQRLAGRPVSRDRALAIVGAIGSALSHAHQRNIAHGDLKPAAVVLTTAGDIKVLDFGFARSHTLNQWVGGEPTIDGAGATTTAAYASAERVNGEEATLRDDVYSLACIAYEMLSGRHPFGGRSAPLARAHGRAPTRINGLSGQQWHALQNALNWNREERRIDVAELVAALGGNDALATTGSFAAMTTGGSIDNPFGRGKGIMLAIALVAVVGGVVWWQLPRFIEPSRVSPVAAPSDVDAERPASSSAPTENVEAPPVAPQAKIPTAASNSAAGTPSVPGAIVAATADPPVATRSGVRSGQATPDPSQPATADGDAQSSPRPATGVFSVEFDKDTYVATESDGLVKLTVRRNGSTRGPARFQWTLRANSAEAGSDFAAIGPGVEEIPPGVRTLTLTIPLVSDVVAENTELFLVELKQIDGGPAVGDQAHAAVILVDDD